MNGTLTPVTPPKELPILLDVAKRHARVETDEEHDLLQTYLEAAVRHYDGPDGILGRALCTQTWDYTIDCFPYGVDETPYGFIRGGIRLPLPPLQSVVSVKYGAALSVWSSAAYTVIRDSFEPAIVPIVGGTYPDGAGYPVVVRFVAGYGNARAVPADIKVAIARRAALLFEQRESGNVPNDDDRELVSYRVWTSA